MDFGGLRQRDQHGFRACIQLTRGAALDDAGSAGQRHRGSASGGCIEPKPAFNLRGPSRRQPRYLFTIRRARDRTQTLDGALDRRHLTCLYHGLQADCVGL